MARAAVLQEDKIKELVVEKDTLREESNKQKLYITTLKEQFESEKQEIIAAVREIITVIRSIEKLKGKEVEAEQNTSKL